MTINIVVWRLAAQILISSLIINTIASNNEHVVGEVNVIPLWNATVNKTDVESCDLAIDNLQDVVRFTGDPLKTCSVQLTSSNGTVALIGIPNGALVYAERQENILSCQRKYVSLAAIKPCFFVFRHPRLLLFLQGDNANDSSITISQMTVNMSVSICPDGTGNEGQYSSKVSQTNHCQVDEFDNLFYCQLSPDYKCSFKFPPNCNVTLGNRVVEIQCIDKNLIYSSHKGLTIYPPGIITLDLDNQNVVELNVNPFKILKSLKRLLLADNDLVILPTGLLSGLRNLEFLTLNGNRLNSLDGNMFNETKKINILNLGDNNFKKLPEHLFYGLGNLIILELSYNNLFVLPERLFVGLKDLQVLAVEANQINLLYENLFNETKKLIYLSLKYNNLVVLPTGLFSGLRNLVTLRLNENQLNSLDGNMFNETKNGTMNLGNNNLKKLPKHLFDDLGNLIELELSNNNLKVLPERLFVGLWDLQVLSVEANQINSLYENLFNDTKMLTHLWLSRNNIVQVPNNLFKGLSNLEHLYLYDNNIIDVNKELFRDLINLKYLFLNNNRFKALSFELFQYTRKINVLDLSGNALLNIPDLSNLRRLFYLNVKGNKMTDITYDTFSNLPKEADLVVSQHEICECFVSHGKNCTAVENRSPFLTCDRLLSDRVLVVVMWLIGLNAIGGNMFVLCRKKKTTDKNKIQTFLLRNLAMSDLLMGVYMLLIASADIYFGKYFPMRAEAWRSGITCRIAGTLSIVSSEASVFFITLISIDRFINIKYLNSRYKLGKRSSAVVAIVIWIMAFALGSVPSSLAGENNLFYDNSHVCIGLPLSKLRIYKTEESEIWTPLCVDDGRVCYWKQQVHSQYVGEINGMIFASVIFLGLNFLCYLVILMCYVDIVKVYFRSSKRVGRNPEMKKQIRLTSRVAAIVLTDFACWFPIIIIGILVQAGVLTLPADVFAWCVTFVLPINSAINPYLYTIVSVISERRKQAPAKNLQDGTGDGTHPSNRKGKTPEVLKSSDTEFGVKQ